MARQRYTLTKEQYEKLLDACKPTICIKVGNSVGPSPQENANSAWCSLGNELGFDGMTVRPVEGTDLDFTAEPKTI